jgi:hypothetical protein
MRLLCNLTQLDLYVSTGIPTYRISGAETGRLRLSDLEERALCSFLVERWRSIERFESSKESESVLRRQGANREAADLISA